MRADPGEGIPDWDQGDFQHLIEEARSFQRVGAAAMGRPEGFLREVIAGLFGVRSDSDGGRFEISPWLPDGWKAMAIRRLRLHRTILDLEVRPRAEWSALRLNVSFGPPIAVAVSLRNAGSIGRVTVDEIPLQGDRAVFTAQGEHEVMFFYEGEAA